MVANRASNLYEAYRSIYNIQVGRNRNRWANTAANSVVELEFQWIFWREDTKSYFKKRRLIIRNCVLIVEKLERSKAIFRN